MKADSEKYQLRGSAAFTSAGRTQVCMHFMYKIILLQDNKSIKGAGVTAGQAWPGAMLMQKAKIKT